MHHLDQHVLIKLVVIITTAVVVVYLAAIGYLDFFGTSSSNSSSSSATTADQLVASGDYEGAAGLYQTEIANLETDLIGAYLGLAKVYVSSTQFADAEAVYRTVLALEPQVKAAYVGLARIQTDQGRLAEAQATVQAGLVHFADDVELLKLEDELATGEIGA